jgi:citrate synthase
VTETAKLTIGETTYELPIIRGTLGDPAIDITSLRDTTGFITLDPSYANTGSTTSSIAHIDGEAGKLLYRGIPIEQLAQRSTFLETSYLLIEGELPSAQQLEAFTSSIRYHTMLHEDFRRFYDSMPKNAHPMAVCAAAVGALSTFYPDSVDPMDPRQVEISTHRLLAKLPTIAAYALKAALGQPFMYPNNRLSYVENMLHLMFATPCEEYEPDPVVAKALDLLLILHADHGQNASTSTVRQVGSTNANLFASISSGIFALWGPRHGGANQEVIETLAEMREQGITAPAYIERVKTRQVPPLSGFGHRVYKNFDPRMTIIKQATDDVLERLGVNSPLLELAKELEEAALHDDYFVQRRLYPNVDFYSGMIYAAIGIPTSMFTAMFAIGRLPGWIAQWTEMHRDRAKIGRPRQVYLGSHQRDYVEIAQR